MKRRLISLAVIAGIAGVAAALFWQDLEEPTLAPATAPPANEQSANSGPIEQLPAFSYPDLQGQIRNSGEWNDKILVLNFWATWCPPCREETPLFVALQEEYADKGVQFVGLAIDDKDAVASFTDTYGVDYPILLADMQAMELSQRLGNRFNGLPYTLVIQPGGKIVARHFGGMKRDQIEPLLIRLSAYK